MQLSSLVLGMWGLRGPESMLRRELIPDESGNLLENFENYNGLYCVTELLSDNKLNFSKYLVILCLLC